MYLKLILLSLILVLIAVAGLGINLLLKKDGKFSGGSCQSAPGLKGEGVSCGCGAGRCSS